MHPLITLLLILSPLTILSENIFAHQAHVPILDLSDFDQLKNYVADLDLHLSEKQKKDLHRPYKHPKRDRGFCYVLAHCKKDHAGIKTSQLNSQALFAFHQLLTRIMSSQGYLKFLKIKQRELLLEEMELASRLYPKEFPATAAKAGQAWQTPLKRNYGDYYLAFFGKLQKGYKWAMRLEGHHYSFRLTIDATGQKIRLSSTPIFLGASPMVVPKPPKKGGFPIWRASEGHHLLAAEAKISRNVIKALGKSMADKAIWPRWPSPTLDGSLGQGVIKKTPRKGGIIIAKQNHLFKKRLAALLKEYLGAQRLSGINPDALLKDLQENGVVFWRGDLSSPMSRFYFRLESERYLFELLQNDLWSVSSEHASNHMHSSLRDLKAEWDQDRLSLHVAKYHGKDNPPHWQKVPSKLKEIKGTVILAHGSAGRKPWTDRWALYLQNLGFDVFILNSFKPRGYSHRKEVGLEVAVRDQAYDIAQAILKAKAEDPKNPLFLVAFSLGGYSSLHLMASHAAYFEKQKPLAGTILFYPMCLDFVGSMTDKNMLFIHGSKDKRAPQNDCQRLAAMSPYKESQKVISLDGLSHGFDIEEFKKPFSSVDEKGYEHIYIYNKKGHQEAKKIVAGFLTMR